MCKNTLIGCLRHTRNWGSGPQLRHMPWLGIELVMFQLTWCLICWATSSRAGVAFVIPHDPLPAIPEFMLILWTWHLYIASGWGFVTIGTKWRLELFPPPSNFQGAGRTKRLEMESITNGSWLNQTWLPNGTLIQNSERPFGGAFWVGEHIHVSGARHTSAPEGWRLLHLESPQTSAYELLYLAIYLYPS